MNCGPSNKILLNKANVYCMSLYVQLKSSKFKKIQDPPLQEEATETESWQNGNKAVLLKH